MGTVLASADALPDWRTFYPLAQKATKSFADGGGGFETSIGSSQIAARPFIASQPLGGALYAFRRRNG
jgi:hypothetical protein